MGIGTQQPLHRRLMVGRVCEVGKSRPYVPQESALWGVGRQAQAISKCISYRMLSAGSHLMLDGIAHVAALLDTFTVMAQIIISPGGVDETQGRISQRRKHSVDPL